MTDRVSSSDDPATAAAGLQLHLSPGLVRVELVGEVDLTVAALLRSSVHDALVLGHTTVVVDLSRTTFLDSSALGALVHVKKQARVFQGTLVLDEPSPAVRRLLALTALDRVFEISVAGDPS